MGEFVIFKNKYKEEGTNQPDWRMMAKGAEDKLEEVGACWTKVSKDGNKFLSCRPKAEETSEPGDTTKANPAADSPFGSEVW